MQWSTPYSVRQTISFSLESFDHPYSVLRAPYSVLYTTANGHKSYKPTLHIGRFAWVYCIGLISSPWYCTVHSSNYCIFISLISSPS